MVARMSSEKKSIEDTLIIYLVIRPKNNRMADDTSLLFNQTQKYIIRSLLAIKNNINLFINNVWDHDFIFIIPILKK